jgi:hypothetical protein
VEYTINDDLDDNNIWKEVEDNRELETGKGLQVVGKRKKDDEDVEIVEEWKVVGRKKKSGKLFSSSTTTKKSKNKESVDRCEVCNKDFKNIEDHLKQSNSCRKNNKEVGPIENKSTNKTRKKVKVQQKQNTKNECSDDDFLPSGNKLPESVQTQLPKAPPAAKVSQATRKTSHRKPNASEQQKYPEFIPTDEFQEVQSWQRVPVGCIIKMNIKTGKNEAKLDPNYELPACLRNRGPEVTPTKNECPKVQSKSQSKPTKTLNADKTDKQKTMKNLTEETNVELQQKQNTNRQRKRAPETKP